MTKPAPRYDASLLHNYARDLLVAAGMPGDKAQSVADILVDGDLMGHTTHGLQLLPSYLREVQSGSMNVGGQPPVVHEPPATVPWDGRRLPGPWLVLEALKKGASMARRCG